MEIEYALEDVVKQTILELDKAERLKKPNAKTNYQNTETLLYALKTVYKAKKHHKEMIKQLKEYGSPQKSHSITSFNPNKGYIEPKIESEVLEENIATEEKAISRIELYTQIVEKAMGNLSKRQLEIINSYYFEGRTLEDISLDINTSPGQISRIKKEAVKELSIFLFPDVAIREILTSSQA